MAEVVVTAFITVIFDKLASALLNKVARSKEIRSELKKMERLLPRIQALLNDASQKELTDQSVKEWLNSLRHLVYDIDDILDALATEEAMHRELTQEPAAAAGGITRKVRKLIPAFCTSFSSSTTTMQHKLKKISIELHQLFDEKKNLGLTVKDKRSQDINRKYQTSVLQPGVVGREVEKINLLQKLLGNERCDQNFSIVPIVGMGGIGKTTLARLLYAEPEVIQHFELKAWVCVSDEFDSFNIGKVIFESIACEEKKFTDPNMLQEALRNQLAGKRILLVLDDVWSERIEDWDTLVPPFHAVTPGSKIIITTRKQTLLQKLGYGQPYHLSKLSHEDALTLFAQHALGANNFDSYPMLGPHGEGIVKKCDGLPLALKALGSLLRTKTNEEKWKALLDNEIWRLRDTGGILPSLRLSYLDLSARLKQLFAYTCLFPKNYVFEKNDLILLWMAEGFLHESTGESMECLGEEYFDELLSRSFFQQMPNDESLFMMHDLMNDLATSVAGEFFIRLDIDMKKNIWKTTFEKYRHMSFVREKFMGCKKFEALQRVNSLRTFLAVPIMVRDCWESFNLSNKVLVDLFLQLPLLRVLCLSKLEINDLPESIGDLKHLRYLNLSETRIAHLPENVCNLYNLQTLIVSGCYNLCKLPHSFLKLKNLRHFDIQDTQLLNMPLGIGEITSLQTLSKIIFGGENEFAISGLKNLRNLRHGVSIHGLDKLQNSVQPQEVKLSQMKLRELVVEWSNVFDESRKQTLEEEVLDVLKPHSDNLQKLKILSYGGREFPKWVGDSSFRKLTVVKIHNCRNCMFLPPLGQLPLLKKLFIKNMDDVKEVGAELLGNGPATFPSLEILQLENMSSWEVWSTITGIKVFPCLQELCIRNCPNLVQVSLKALPLLRVLKVSNCGDGLLTSLLRVASSVTKLTINSISGLGDEVWGSVVQFLGVVEELSIQYCNEIRYLWESGEEAEACKVFVSLNKLEIYSCDNLVRLGGEKEEEGGNLLTSLRKLDIRSCKNLKRLSCPSSVETLNISGCASITCVSFPTGGEVWQKLKSLTIWGCNQVFEEELQKVLIINTTTPLVLESLYISGWKDLKSITKLNYFIQLTRLVIQDCDIIKSFPELQNLASLKHLIIANCRSMDGPPPSPSSSISGSGVWPPKLHSLEIGLLKSPISEWGPLPTSLVDLFLYGGSSAAAEDDVTSFPTSLLLPSSSLTRLELCEFKKLETISKGLQHLTSLRHLNIYLCSKMKDLPEKLLPSLLSLYICNVTNEVLKEKLSRRGSYWPLISHIPCVDISSYEGC